MIVKKASSRAWAATGIPGVERCLLHEAEAGERAAMLRFAQGARFPHRVQAREEEIVVLSGMVMIGGVELAQGDYACAARGSDQDVAALSDALVFLRAHG